MMFSQIATDMGVYLVSPRGPLSLQREKYVRDGVLELKYASVIHHTDFLKAALGRN